MSAGLQTQIGGGTGTARARVLVGSGDSSVAPQLSEALIDQGCVVSLEEDLQKLNSTASEEIFDAVFLDMGTAPDWELLREVQRLLPDTGIVVSLTSGSEDSRLALQHGAVACLGKPTDPEHAAMTLQMVAINSRLQRELSSLDRVVRSLRSEEELIGCSPAVRRLQGVMRRAGENEATVLIEGKEGTGKTLVARLIHANGRRSQGPFKVLLAESTTEEELDSAVLQAGSGTLLVESVDKLSSACQSRLVRYLKDRNLEGEENCRIVTTTSARLAELTAKGAFREDLYYRLNIFPIVVPTLVERREDIPQLAAHFGRIASQAEGRPDRGFTPSAMILLETHPWPGNVSQLKNTVIRAHAMAQGEAIDRVHLFGPATGMPAPSAQMVGPEGGDGVDGTVHEDDILPFQEEEKRILSRALKATKGNVRRAAHLLGIGRATLYRKIQIYQLRLQ